MLRAALGMPRVEEAAAARGLVAQIPATTVPANSAGHPPAIFHSANNEGAYESAPSPSMTVLPILATAQAVALVLRIKKAMRKARSAAGGISPVRQCMAS
jgi:hypothetical protein